MMQPFSLSSSLRWPLAGLAGRVSLPFSLLLLLLMSVACASAPTAVEPAPEEVSAPPAEAAIDAPNAEGAKVNTSAEPADEDLEGWIFDEERDHYYRVVEVEKIEGTYRWLDEETIRAKGGVVFEVVNHDEERFWLKAWKPKPFEAREKPTAEELAAEQERRAAEREAIEATYQTEWATVDRIVLESADTGLPRSGQWRNNFTLADMDGDGNLDIVFGPSRKGAANPNVFLSDGAGSWTRYPITGFDARPLDYGGVAVGDLNGDERLDIAFGIHLRGMTAFVREGEYEFVPYDEGIEWDHPGKGGDASSFSSRRLEILDWDGDGDNDLLALGEGPKGRSVAVGQGSGVVLGSSRGMALYENLGEGRWAPRQLDPSGDFGDDFELADLDGDGRLDIAVATRRRGFKGVLHYGVEGGGLEMRLLDALRDGAFLSAVLADDLDGDGRVDLAFSYRTAEADQWRSGVDLFFNEGDDGWSRVPLVAAADRRDYPAIASGDLDGDGRRDIVATTGEGVLEVFLGKGKRRFLVDETPESPSPVAGCDGRWIVLEDIDRDGRDDILVAYSGEKVGLGGIAGMNQPGCPGQGSLRAWRSVPRP